MESVIEDQDREALATLEEIALYEPVLTPKEHAAILRGCEALRSLIETRDRIARRLRTSEFND